MSNENDLDNEPQEPLEPQEPEMAHEPVMPTTPVERHDGRKITAQAQKGGNTTREAMAALMLGEIDELITRLERLDDGIVLHFADYIKSLDKSFNNGLSAFDTRFEAMQALMAGLDKQKANIVAEIALNAKGIVTKEMTASLKKDIAELVTVYSNKDSQLKSGLIGAVAGILVTAVFALLFVFVLKPSDRVNADNQQQATTLTTEHKESKRNGN